MNRPRRFFRRGRFVVAPSFTQPLALALPLEIHLVTHTHWDREWYHSAEVFRQRLVELVDDLIDSSPRQGESSCSTDRRSCSRITWRFALIAGSGSNLFWGWADRGGALVRACGRVDSERRGTRAEPPRRPSNIGGVRGECSSGVVLPGFIWSSGDAARACGWLRITADHPLAWIRKPAMASRGRRSVACSIRNPGAHVPPPARRIRVWRVAADRPRRGRDSMESDPFGAGAKIDPRRHPVANGADHHERQTHRDQAVRVLQDLAAATGDRIQPTSLRAFAESVVSRAGAQRLQSISGELRDSYGYTWTLQGTLSTRAAQKRANARAERALVRGAEPWSGLAWLRDHASRHHFIRVAWKTLLAAHPHDTLCGTSTDEVALAMDARVRSAHEQADAIDGASDRRPVGSRRDDRARFTRRVAEHRDHPQ